MFVKRLGRQRFDVDVPYSRNVLRDLGIPILQTLCPDLPDISFTYAPSTGNTDRRWALSGPL